MESLNAYELLGLQPAASDKEITKAYRAKALQYHPDKLGDKVKSTDQEKNNKMFHLIKQAYDILCDKEKREELEAKIRAEQQRKMQQNKMSLQRKQMKTELEARENLAKNKTSTLQFQKMQHELEVQKFRQEMERAEQKRIRRMQQDAVQHAELQKSQLVQEEQHRAHELQAAKELSEFEATVRLRWVHSNINTLPSKESDVPDIDQDYIKKIGSLFGLVEDVVISSKKNFKTSKRSALLVFANIVSANAFMEASSDRFPQLSIFERSWAYSADNTNPTHSTDSSRIATPDLSSNINSPLDIKSKIQNIANLKIGKDSPNPYSQTIKKDWLRSENVSTLYADVHSSQMSGAHMSFNDFEAIVLARMRVFDQ
ncbi:hypothetical protein BB561_002373 [Smittium simulii]|uniref:J domain-containing protein n=1 Tax=Smittium simulii TaxID=133385 RepID=A0A2T9YQP4_9FUNG|nr:hypothetical protein BB561_002373 [Smittium simulii]